jgi:hypothetical protein
MARTPAKTAAPKADKPTGPDWTVLPQKLDARKRDAKYNELCERYNAGERSDELAKEIES